MKDLFRKIPLEYIYSINGRDNILIRDVLSYLQYTYGPHVTKDKLYEALKDEGFRNRGHVALKFEDDNSVTSARSWSRFNPRVTTTTTKRQKAYSKEEIYKHHGEKMVEVIKKINTSEGRDQFFRDGNLLISDEIIRSIIKEHYPGITVIDLGHIVKEVVKEMIQTKMLIFNDNTKYKSRYWKVYAFILNKPVKKPELDSVHIIYQELFEKNENLYVTLLKFPMNGALYTITLRDYDFEKLQHITQQIGHVVNEISRKEDYKFREGVYLSDRYIKSKKNGALEKNLFKDDASLFTNE